jgi:hypothetical protein
VAMCFVHGQIMQFQVVNSSVDMIFWVFYQLSMAFWAVWDEMALAFVMSMENYHFILNQIIWYI